MLFKILEYKPIIKDRNNNDIVDLSKRSINYKEDINYKIIDMFLIGDDMSMRPDLVNYVAYNTVDNFDLLLKFNGISNPFSIDVGDVIFVPEKTFMESQLDKNKTDIKKEIYQQYVDSSKKIQQDPRLQTYLAKINSKRISKYNLPPNLAIPGSTEAKVQNGEVTLGVSQ